MFVAEVAAAAAAAATSAEFEDAARRMSGRYIAVVVARRRCVAAAAVAVAGLDDFGRVSLHNSAPLGVYHAAGADFPVCCVSLGYTLNFEGSISDLVFCLLSISVPRHRASNISSLSLLAYLDRINQTVCKRCTF